MILRRLGNKKKIAPKIYSLFLQHATYIEPFFGAGGMYFFKPRAKYNLLNDLDNEVFNLWRVVRETPDLLRDEIISLPIHPSISKYWKKHKEIDPISRAARFLFISNFGYMGMPETLRIEGNNQNSKAFIFRDMGLANKLLKDCVFDNKNAVDFLRAIRFHGVKPVQNPFIYCDPPYLKTGNNYTTKVWGSDDLYELVKGLQATNAPFAISEFYSKDAISVFNDCGLFINVICERQTMKNRNTEILATNYNLSQKTLF
jgi:DNA adenine methylase